MTILDEVLIEEWNRQEYIVSVLQQELDSLNSVTDQERREDYQNRIDRARFDQRKIEAALQVAGIDIRDHIEERNRRKG